MAGFYVSFNFTFQGEFGYFASEIKSSQAEGAHPELEHCQYSCSLHRERLSPTLHISILKY